MKPVLANWNGQEMDLSEVRVSVLDRAFLFGDAVYEVIRVYGKHAWKIDEHFNRLQSSLEAIKIHPVDLSEIRRQTDTTLTNSSIREGIIYIQVTRGEASRTHYFPRTIIPNCLIYVDEFTDPYKDLRAHGVHVITYPDIRWSRNYIKVTSLLANCLAAEAAFELGCLESILIDSQGFVTEGSHTSIFAVRNGCLLVAPDGPNILPGITKRQVLNLANDSNIPIKEQRLAKSDIQEIDELFLSGTPEEILPIISVDNRPVGNGKPGPIALKLQEQFRETLVSWLDFQDNSSIKESKYTGVRTSESAG